MIHRAWLRRDCPLRVAITPVVRRLSARSTIGATVSISVCLFIAVASVLGFQSGAALANEAPKQPRKYADMPWHLVDLWWDVGRETEFESYSIDVTISEDLPETTRLYIAPIGLGHLSEPGLQNKTPFYGGIQTQADGNTRSDSRLRTIGPGFLMSMWGERSLDAIRPADGGLLQSSGHEGDFVSVRRPFRWKKGTFTYRIVKMDRQIVDGEPKTWVGAFVHIHETDENVFIGALRFPGKDLLLDNKIASFVEVYGPEIPVAEIPKVVVTFGNLKVNSEPVTAPGCEVVYPKDVPDYADAQADEKSVVITVGQEVKGRTERQLHLLRVGE